MSLTPKAVFCSLSDTFRNQLLNYRGIKPTDEISTGDFQLLSKKQRETLEQDLNCIATLGSDYAGQLVHQYLSDAGWGPEDLAATRSDRDRACALLCRFPDDFSTALAVWNSNRMRGRLDREQGFRLPDLKGYKFSPLTDDKLADLTALLSAVITKQFPAKIVTRVVVFERSAHGLPTRSKTVLQCDVSMGDDPETIGIIDNGIEANITIIRLSRISAIIDPEARTLFVGTKYQSKVLHKAIAKTLTSALFDIEAAPEQLRPLRVYPELCKSPVRFRFSTTDEIEAPRISELRYRLNGTPSSLQFSVREEDPGGDIHAHIDVQRHSHRMRIWRAAIDFVFKSKAGRPPLRRQITLTEPDGISFGGAFPDERLTIERVLSLNGLIDDRFDWQAGARFSNIARLVVAHHIAELRQTWQPLTVTTLQDEGILVQGQPHLRAWCRACGGTHEIERRQTDNGDDNVVLCPVKTCALMPDHVDTMVLCPDGLVKWLVAHAAEKNASPIQIGQPSDRAWLIGTAASRAKGKSFEIILAFDVDLPETAQALNDFLLSRHPEGPGLILTLTEAPVQKVFPNKWRAVPISAACEVTKNGLKFKASAAWSIAHGRSAPNKQKSAEDWDAIRSLFKQMYPGTGRLQPFTVANEMIAAKPDVCDMTPTSLASHLKSLAPERFLR